MTCTEYARLTNIDELDRTHQLSSSDLARLSSSLLGPAGFASASCHIRYSKRSKQRGKDVISRASNAVPPVIKFSDSGVASSQIALAESVPSAALRLVFYDRGVGCYIMVGHLFDFY